MGEESLALFFSWKNAAICLHLKITFQLRALLEGGSFWVCVYYKLLQMEEIILVVKLFSG